MLLILILIFFPFSYSALDAMLINSHLWNLRDSYCSFDVDYQPMGQTPFFAAWRTPVAEMFIITMYCNNHDVLLKYWTDCIYTEVIALVVLHWKIFYFALSRLDSDFIRTQLHTNLKRSLNAFLNYIGYSEPKTVTYSM